MQQGLPVIAFGRGTIPEYVDESCGYIVPVGEDFVAGTLRWWYHVSEWLREAGQTVRCRFESLRPRGLGAWGQLEVTLLA